MGLLQKHIQKLSDDANSRMGEKMIIDAVQRGRILCCKQITDDIIKEMHRELDDARFLVFSDDWSVQDSVYHSQVEKWYKKWFGESE